MANFAKSSHKFDPCPECGSTTRYHKVGLGKTLKGPDYICACQKGITKIGGIRSHSEEPIPQEVIRATIKRLTACGFQNVTVEKATGDGNPWYYRHVITTTGHHNEDVQNNLMQMVKGERCYVVSWDYGQAKIERHPFRTYTDGWNSVERTYRINSELGYSVMQALGKGKSLGDVIYTSADFDTEQKRKEVDDLNRAIAKEREDVKRAERELGYRQDNLNADKKRLEERKAQFEQTYGINFVEAA